MKKRLLCLLTAVSLIVFPVSASETPSVESYSVSVEQYSYDSSLLSDGPIIIEESGIRHIIAKLDQDITPYLTYLSQASCNLVIEGDTVGFYGMVTMHRNTLSRVILTLQRSTDGIHWTDVPDMEWLQIWYTNGAHMLSKSITDLPGGYYYRAHNKASALASNYAELETVDVYSDAKYKA